MNYSTKLIALGFSMLLAGNATASLDKHNFYGTFYMSQMDSYLAPQKEFQSVDSKIRPAASLTYLGELKDNLYISFDGKYFNDKTKFQDTFKTLEFSTKLVRRLDLSGATDLLLGAGLSAINQKAKSGYITETCAGVSTCEAGFTNYSDEYKALGLSGLIAGNWYFNGDKRAGFFIGASAEATNYFGELESNPLFGGDSEKSIYKTQQSTFHTSADIGLGYHAGKTNGMHYTVKAGARMTSSSGYLVTTAFDLAGGGGQLFLTAGVSM